MKALLSFLWAAGLSGFLATAAFAAGGSHLWEVKSPTHEQTFSYGSERHRQWLTRGADRHLALALEFTNDPYVDRIEPRQYDDFTFDFPDIRLGSDGHTFYYQAPGGRSVPVASRHPGFLGIEEIELLGTSTLMIQKPHGYLSIELLVSNRPLFRSDDDSL